MYRWVLSLDLKAAMEGASRMSGGSWFHKRGAATAKARSPFCFSLDRGMWRRPLLDDLRVLGAEWGCTRSAIYKMGPDH